MLSVIAAGDSARLASVRRSGWLVQPDVAESVAAALEAVRRQGDSALVEAMRKLTEGQYDAAKLRVPIPMLEGARAALPPEVADGLRLASELVAGELLAQAERDLEARVAVISESRPLLDAVAQLLDTLEVRTLARGDIIAEVVARSCYLIHAANREELLRTVDAFAAERVALHVRDADPYLDRLRHAGAVFVGDMTPIAAGDFLTGTNCVLPAAGTARFRSGLNLSDFVRSFSVVENSRERMLHDAQPLAALAEFEGLPQHAQTSRMRSGA